MSLLREMLLVSRVGRRTCACSRVIFSVAAVALLFVALVPPPVSVLADGELAFVEDVRELPDGTTVVRYSTPLGPPEVTGLEASAPVVNERQALTLLSDVPVFDWCYGCSATTAAMLFGYYDRNGYPNMYTGPANGGVCPLENYTDWYRGECPLSATKQGLDGLETTGHVDDYWHGYESDEDPYYENWPEHGYADCTGDFMGTSQWYNWENVDGSTSFFFYSTNQPLDDFTGDEGGSPPHRDGCHGMRLFVESRGYTVVENYNQRIEGWDDNPGGFSLQQYQDEIDTGRPVVIQVSGHTMLGVGYGDDDTIYVHDTWDHEVHEMTWGGQYQGLQHFGVSVIVMAAPTGEPLVETAAASAVEETSATLNGSIQFDGGDDCEWQFSYGTTSGAYNDSTGWTGSLGTGDDFQHDVTGLTKGETYYFVAEAQNMYGTASGAERHFTTRPDAPSGLTATTAGTSSVDLAWTSGEGAEKTRVQRATGGYPADPYDGTTVYFDSGSTTTDTGLDPDTTYYYRAWSHVDGSDVWSDGYADAQATTEALPYPEVTTQAATAVTETSAQLNALLTDDGDETCDYRFEYDIDSGEPYASDTGWTTGVTIGQTFDESVSDLDAGTTYYFRGQAQNSTGIGSGTELSFTTRPGAPGGLVAEALSTGAIDLSWTAGDGSTETLIRRKTGGYPVDRADGEQAYLGPAESYTDSGLQPGTTYYYRAWAHVVPGEQWSDGCGEAVAQTESIQVGISTIMMSPGSSAPASLHIEGAVDLAEVSVILDFDPAVVQLTGFESGDLGGVTHDELSEANASGQLTMSWTSAVGCTGDFTYATLTMEGAGASGESTPLDLTVGTFLDSDGASLAHEVEDGSATLLALMEGDANGDLSTSILDAMYVAQYTVGIRSLDPARLLCADTNDDGKVTILDAMHIAQYTIDPDGSRDVLFKPLWQSPEDDGLLPPQ